MPVASLRIPKHVRSIIDPDGAVLMDVRKGQYYSLNGIGAEVWTKLEQGVAAERIAEVLSEETAVPREVVEADVTRFLDRLREKSLLEIAG